MPIATRTKQRGTSTRRTKAMTSRTVSAGRSRSVAGRTSTRSTAAAKRGVRRSRPAAGGPTMDQLYNEARRRNIRGRSTMTKSQLIRALSR